jgi:hypothetical protein
MPVFICLKKGTLSLFRRLEEKQLFLQNRLFLHVEEALSL